MCGNEKQNEQRKNKKVSWTCWLDNWWTFCLQINSTSSGMMCTANVSKENS